jgi:predicted ATPase/class 3 adenylate cyclase
MAGLPSGMVTFLFTDIEGSTPLWEREPEQMHLALARHHAILRRIIDTQGGIAYKMIGDAFQSAFVFPAQALATALAAQRAFVAQTWETSQPIRVRMGIHVGPAVAEGNDYTTTHTLNRAARIMAAGHGGQILLSREVADLVRRDVPTDVTLHDMGQHRMKGLTHLEHLFQVVSPDLPAAFPPLKTLDYRPDNLPLQSTPVIGRASEVAALTTILSRSETRLVTLTGPGGTGKTRLALQVAADLRNTFRDGVYLVSLAPISDPNLVAPTIAQTMDVRETGARSVVENLRGYLRSKQLLLLLDNFEQVVAAASVVAELLAEAPGLHVLATSRVPLHVRGEQEFAVLPLAVPDSKHPPAADQLARYGAVELFVQRARAIRPDFVLTDENALAVVEICRRLDGLPLAIELAAVRSKIFPPRALLAQFGSRLTFLIGGARDAPARQQTLRATIEWSYALLDADEQALFCQLGVFVGGFTLSAAAAVCSFSSDLDGDVVARVESLVDKSMVRADLSDDEPRFFMFETLREYAVERLVASGEAEAVRRQHAQFFLALAEEAEPQMFFQMRAYWLECLEREHDNLRAALRWCSDQQAAEAGLRLGGLLCPFWETRSYLTEGRKWLAELLALAAARPRTAARAKALRGAGNLAYAQGDHVSAETLLTESLAIGREVGDWESIAWSQERLGGITGMRRQDAHSLAYLEESVALFRAIGNQRGAAWSLAGLGFHWQLMGDTTAAGRLLEESVAIGRKIGDTSVTAFALHMLAQVRERQGDLITARVYEEESLAIWRGQRDPRNMAFTIVVLGRLALAQGHNAAARALWNEGLPIAAKVQDPWCIGCFLGSFVALAAAEHQPVRALRLAAATDTVFQMVGTPLPLATGDLVERGRAQAMQAVDAVTQARARAEGQAMTVEQAVAYALEEAPPEIDAVDSSA